MGSTAPTPDATAAPQSANANNLDAFLITEEGTEVVAPGVCIQRGKGNSIVLDLDAGLVIVDSGPAGHITAACSSQCAKSAMRRYFHP